MNIVLFLAGVLDPKWPLTLCEGALPETQPDRVVMSPFDESALETALRIRDANPGTQIRAIVAGSPASEKIARTVLALNVADVSLLDLGDAWNQNAVATQLASQCGEADLVLIGREFGDCDDGLVPPMAAALTGRHFFGRVQAVEASGDIRLMREAGASEQWLAVSGPTLASVTNDRRNRLRKPLMKNVMMARQAAVAQIVAPPSAPSPIGLGGVDTLAAARAPVNCRWIEGSTVEQAQAVAALLRQAAPA